ncbi:MAG: bifunctional precorrin-2 dehydrogenase/sirohydrochlorin ferrochelatase [Nitrospiraceae bacterium]|nr:MAG: bifunctional precorrin-2 dehydrogenase/sirohydrochlorin ferrochelatase [Nitrospiraceae bacterium]
MNYYPAFLDLNEKKTVVIGGGAVAERKVRALLRTGAQVSVISPDITAGLLSLKDRGAIKHYRRHYRKGDLQGALIVIAATSSSTVNAKIADDAGHLVNVVDMPEKGNFIVPSRVKRGPLTIAISTEGASPALAKAIRKEIEGRYDKDFGLYLYFLETLRKKAMVKIRDRKKREKFLKSLASAEMLENLRKKGFKDLSKSITASFNRLYTQTHK